MRRTLHLACAGILLAAALADITHAEQEKTATTLGTISVYATRSPQPLFNLPAIVSQIDADAPGNALAGDISDLLEFTPGVEVEGGPRRNGQTLSIRGFDDEAILTLIDGRRQNYESTHDGRFYVDSALLKSVEVVKGASSAIYGGGAIGGVVAMETKDASDLLAPGETGGVLASLGWRSANDEFSPTLTGFHRSGGWDLLGSISYRDSGDIELGNGRELDAEDEMLSGLLKISRTVGDFHTFRFQAQYLDNDAREPNNGNGEITNSNPIVEKDVEDRQFSLKYAFEQPGNDRLAPKLHLYYNETEVVEEDISGRNTGRVQSREIETLGFTLDNQSRFTVGEKISHTLSYGFEIYEDEQTGRNNKTRLTDPTSPEGTRGGVPNAEATNWGAYLQNEITIKSAAGEFLIIPAVRYDDYKSDDEGGRSQDENELSPKLSISFMPRDNIMLFGSWSKAFRAPNLTEIYATGVHFPAVPPVRIPCTPNQFDPTCVASNIPGGPAGFRTVFEGLPENRFRPNPDLKPETVTSIEFGFGLSSGPAQVKASWFKNEGDDFITSEVIFPYDIPTCEREQVPMAPPGVTRPIVSPTTCEGSTIIRNIPNAEIRGWEVEGRYDGDPITVRVGASYVRAVNEDTGNWLSNNVPLTLVADVSYRLHAPFGSVIGWRARFAEENDRRGEDEQGLGEDDASTPGYGVHDLYYRYESGRRERGSFTMDLGVENVFDKTYTKRFSSLKEEGRSFVAKMAYQW